MASQGTTPTTFTKSVCAFLGGVVTAKGVLMLTDRSKIITRLAERNPVSALVIGGLSVGALALMGKRFFYGKSSTRTRQTTALPIVASAQRAAPRAGAGIAARPSLLDTRSYDFTKINELIQRLFTFPDRVTTDEIHTLFSEDEPKKPHYLEAAAMIIYVCSKTNNRQITEKQISIVEQILKHIAYDDLLVVLPQAFDAQASLHPSLPEIVVVAPAQIAYRQRIVLRALCQWKDSCDDAVRKAELERVMQGFQYQE